ncbi:unnamed protein product [Darwinula stevensoni]|uniref:Uncharacterized protein n=1 Tax=Darwinula stevensoni TaxID=69355 RepID=A0A7R8X925_9CRUS|nr:unnamed protein product [Darwinula stevensoni]CAG0885140.1 unnamed protein product [Darwinula stevensoni]
MEIRPLVGTAFRVEARRDAFQDFEDSQPDVENSDSFLGELRNSFRAARSENHSQKRVSDQRLAELEALISLGELRRYFASLPVGYGIIDVNKIGKKKRARRAENDEDSEYKYFLMQVLKRLREPTETLSPSSHQPFHSIQSSRVGSGRVESGRVGSGRVGSGQVGSDDHLGRGEMFSSHLIKIERVSILRNEERLEPHADLRDGKLQQPENQL